MGRGTDKASKTNTAIMRSDSFGIDDDGRYRVTGIFKGELIYIERSDVSDALLSFHLSQTAPKSATETKAILRLANDDPDLSGIEIVSVN